MVTLLVSVRNLPLAGERERLAFSRGDLKFHSFSDNICVSAKESADGISHILHSLEALAISLLDEGTLLRGAIVKGPLHHDDEVVFGNALVNAANLEGTVSLYPRIMLTREVAMDVRRLLTPSTQDDFVENFIQRSDDGPFFLNVLVGMKYYLENADLRPDYIQRYNLMATRLQERFDLAVDEPRHYEKMKWFARYWNESIRNFRDVIHPVTGPGTNTFD